MTGSFFYSVDFDPAADRAFTLVSAGDSDFFLLKMDSNGGFLWARGIGGYREDYAYDIAADASANVYVSGYFNDVVDFDPFDESYYRQTASQRGFVARYDAAGRFNWEADLEAPTGSTSMVGSLAIGPDGRVLSTGMASATGGEIDFDPTTDIQNAISAGATTRGYLWSLNQKAAPEAAIVGLPPSAVTEGETLALGVKVSDADSTYFTYVWSVIRDGVDFASGTGPALGLYFADQGTYHVKLVVTDETGLADTVAGAVTEDVSPNMVFGILNVTDPDTGEAVFRTSLSLNGTYGTFTFNASSGAWTYTLGNSRAVTNALSAGQIVYDALTVVSEDDTARQAIVITITGADETEVVASIHLLNATACGALTASGNARLTVPGAILVNSNCPSHAIAASGNAVFDAESILVAGGVSKSGNVVFRPMPISRAAVASDPLASLELSAPPVGPSRGAVNCSAGTLTLLPGVYSQIKATGNCQLVLQSGIYDVVGGGVSVSGNARVNGTAGLLLYNGRSTGANYGAISISGNGTLDIRPLASGPYAGLSVYQPR